MLRLRPAAVHDLNFLLALERQYHAEGYVCTDSREVHEQRMANPDARYFLIESEGRAAGTMIVRGLDSPHRSIELKRICIAAPGVGTGREAIRQLLKMVFGEWNAHRVWLDVYPENERARRTYAALGFKEEGTLRECILQNGLYRSQIIMSILEDEYRAQTTHFYRLFRHDDSPGVQMDANEQLRILREAQELARQGAFEPALDAFCSFFNAGNDPSLTGVRLSLALRSCAKLGERYPPARNLLEDIRSSKLRLLTAGAADRAAFEEVEAINHVLDEQEQTVQLFKAIATENRAFAERCFQIALPALVQAKCMDLARSFIPAPEQAFDRIISRDLNDAMVRDVTAEEAACLLSVLVQTGETTLARELLQKAAASIGERLSQEIASEVARLTGVSFA